MKKQTIETIIDAFYPKNIKCVFCDEDISFATPYSVCGNCNPPFIKKFCIKCGRSINNLSSFCLACKKNQHSFDQARSVFTYEKDVIRVVRGLKFGNKKYLSEPLGAFLASLYKKTDWAADLITCVPLSQKRLEERGYNQAQLLAENMTEYLDIDFCSDALIKVRHTPYQARLNRIERMANILGAFEINKERKPLLKGKSIVLVDDLMTTGATADQCATILKKNGAAKVFVLTVAMPKQKL